MRAPGNAEEHVDKPEHQGCPAHRPVHIGERHTLHLSVLQASSTCSASSLEPAGKNVRWLRGFDAEPLGLAGLAYAVTAFSLPHLLSEVGSRIGRARDGSGAHMVHHEAGDAGEGLQQHQREHRHPQLEVVQVVVERPVLGDCHDEGCQHNAHPCSAASSVCAAAMLHVGWLEGGCSSMQDVVLVVVIEFPEGAGFAAA